MPLLIHSLICIKGQLYRARFGLVGTNKENQIVIFFFNHHSATIPGNKSTARSSCLLYSGHHDDLGKGFTPRFFFSGMPRSMTMLTSRQNVEPSALSNNPCNP